MRQPRYGRCHAKCHEQPNGSGVAYGHRQTGTSRGEFGLTSQLVRVGRCSVVAFEGHGSDRMRSRLAAQRRGLDVSGPRSRGLSSGPGHLSGAVGSFHVCLFSPEALRGSKALRRRMQAPGSDARQRSDNRIGRRTGGLRPKKSPRRSGGWIATREERAYLSFLFFFFLPFLSFLTFFGLTALGSRSWRSYQFRVFSVGRRNTRRMPEPAIS